LLKTLIEELGDLEVERIQAYAATTDKTKVEILTRCGFDIEATMPDQLRIGGKKSDLEVYCANIQLQS
jgi:L-amino acid N-acyltransferase YncA